MSQHIYFIMMRFMDTVAGAVGQPYHIGQSLARPQKIVMSQSVTSSALHTSQIQTVTTAKTGQ